MKNQKGITLVALVITIIVLLILAGVSISLVVGNNGVLTRASSAVETNREAEAKQDVKMAVASCYTDYMAAWASNSSVTLAGYLDATKIHDYLSDSNATITPVMYSTGAEPTSGQTADGYKYAYSGADASGRDSIVFKVSDNGTVTFADEEATSTSTSTEP